MSVLIGLLGLFVGWALGFAGEAWRERRRARDAARLVSVELAANLATFDALLGAGGDSSNTLTEVRDTAWEAYAGLLVRIADGAALQELVVAYAVVRGAMKVAGLNLRMAGMVEETQSLLNDFRTQVAELESATASDSATLAELRKKIVDIESDLRQTEGEITQFSAKTTLTLLAGLVAASILASLRWWELLWPLVAVERRRRRGEPAELEATFKESLTSLR